MHTGGKYGRKLLKVKEKLFFMEKHEKIFNIQNLLSVHYGHLLEFATHLVSSQIIIIKQG